MANQSIYELMGEHMTLVDTNVDGVKAIAPPPAGFNPREASETTLLRLGILPRPDPAQAPKAAAIWDRIMGQPFEHIVPKLTPRPEKRDHTVHVDTIRPHATGDQYSPNWSGGLIFNPNTSTDPFQSVYGEWTVPSVVPPASGDGDWWSLAWIGVDGYNSSDVMQIGTGQHVKRAAGKVTTEYFAWIEWYTYGWNTVNLTVNPGDSISANISNLGVKNGVLQASGRLTNLTTGQTVAPVVSAPSGTVFQGNVAEWIMERPSFNNVRATLPRFGEVAFTNVLTCSKAAKGFQATAGQPVHMTSDGTATGKRYASGQSDPSWDSLYVASS